ncbi:hypothetical protein GM418_00770 [Maribellus comscasis]|uniref:Shikimate kinase n=1 Tax=Maribellus comscasis TaxID=2681766 RepID=A0A6I6JQ42_9BACT|nr:shikimate kinase [Maribellus comscasis]QGY42237.1 hypothetical protein GM418_00770 [Maribellus comscasis]
MPEKTIFLLIGQKGSGKSFIGNLFDKHFYIPFIRVEDWAKNRIRKRKPDDDAYIQEVFLAIENGIRKEMQKKQKLVFESLGLSAAFETMLNKLKSDFEVITIKIKADPQICLARVKTRDQSIHVNISDKQVEKINKQFLATNSDTDFVIENNSKSSFEIINEIETILNSLNQKK